MQLSSSLPSVRSDAVRSVLRHSARAGLVLFHAVLLWQRIADSTLLDPVVLAKYLGAVALLGGAVAFRRYAPQHLRGRRALLGFWLVVLLLHAIAPAASSARNLDSELAAVVQLGVVVPMLLATAHLAAVSIAHSLRVSGASPATAFVSAAAVPVAHRPSRAPPRR